MQDANVGLTDVSSCIEPANNVNLAEDELDRLIRTHGSRVFSICRALLGSHDDAQDAAQETFLRCLSVAPQLTGDISPFVNTVARNVCRDELRRRGRHPVTADTRDQAAWSAGPETTVLQRQTLRAVWRDLSTNDQRLLGYRISGFRCGEIASRLGVPVSTVTSGLSRAYRKAHRALAASQHELQATRSAPHTEDR